MNSSHFQESQKPVTNNLTSMMESVNNLAGIMSGLVGDIVRIQSSASQARITENMQRLTSLASPEGRTQFIWQYPGVCQTQTQPELENLLDSFTVLTRSQQQLLEWGCQTYSSYVQYVSNSLSQMNSFMLSRRVSAEIINFADRRATSQRMLEESAVKAESSRAARQAAA